MAMAMAMAMTGTVLGGTARIRMGWEMTNDERRIEIQKQ